MRKQIDLNDPILAKAMREQREAFVTHFGRKPTLHDPIFFCWHASTPKPMCDLCHAECEHDVIEAAKQVGIDPAWALKAVGIDDPLGSLKTMN
jgi:hypothetical protein